MISLLNKLLFKTRSDTYQASEGKNPWLKNGEYIYLHSKKGRYQVVSVNNDGFFVVKENTGKNHKPEFHSWQDFKRWSSKPSIKEA